MIDFTHNCQKCGKNDKSVHSREVYLPHYKGPCGDSFCYASCDSSSCRPVRTSICKACNDEIDAARNKAQAERAAAKAKERAEKEAAEAKAAKEPPWTAEARKAGWRPPRSRR